MKKILTLLLAVVSISAFGQNTQPSASGHGRLDVSNINPLILTGGDMFWDLLNPAFEVPRGSGKHSIFAGALWIGGKDAQNNLYVSAQTYRQGAPSDAGYWPGPVGTTHNSAHSYKYDKVWKVSKTQIDNHIQNFNNPNYSMPAEIVTWPGNGNPANGEAANLAPYVDVNNDGFYTPFFGDYPLIKGDQAMYVILNDKGNVKEPLALAMNAEIHVMYYGYNSNADPAVFNTLFSEYRIINRGQINLQDFYAGLWIDFNLGNWADDYIGCDTTTNRFFVYNGDNFDEDSVIITYPNSPGFPPSPQISYVNSYGANPPAQSVMFLDQKMSHFMSYYGTNHSKNGNPTRPNDYYNFLRGYWRDNTQLTYGGDGTNPANPPANYMFAGDPVTATGWSERNTLSTPAVNVPYDRRGVGSIGPFNLNAGQELKFTVAYTYSRGTSNLNSVTQSQADAITVQNFFRSQVMGTPKKVTAKNTLGLFPNPAQDYLNLQLPATFLNKNVTVLIADYTGRTVLQKNLKAEENLPGLNIATVSKGIYQVTVISENQTISSRLVKL